MSLSLTVSLYRGQPPSQPISLTLDRQGASIGRANSSNLVLADPEKYVSSRHGTIEYRDSAYYLTDHSANGIFLLPSETPLGKNKESVLSNGDRLGIGEYQILVEITPDVFLAPASTSTDPLQRPAQPSQNQDPFMDLGADPISEIIADAKNSEDDFDFFGANSSTPTPPGIAATPDHVPVMEEAFGKIHGSPEAKELLPEDWFGTDDGQQDTDPDKTLAGSFSPPAPRRPAPKITANATPAPAAERQPEPAPEKQPEIAAATDPTHPESSVDRESIRQFCQGAGISDELFQQLSAESFYSIGKMLKISIQGAMDVLTARTEIKNEMRLDVTTLRAVENNPIKFSINADEALTRLLQGSDYEGYMEPVQALEEAFNDIKAHQMAVIAGMQMALNAVLKRFDPDELEARLQKKSPISASIPIHKQAKLWSQFEQLYEDIEHEAQDDFSRLFGRAFSSAYEKQIGLFRSQSREGDK